MAKPGERTHWKRPKRPRPWANPNALTEEEGANVIAALWLVHSWWKRWGRVAELMGVSPGCLRRVVDKQTPPMAGLAIRVARLAGLSTDRVLEGRFRKPIKCGPKTGRYRQPRSIYLVEQSCQKPALENGSRLRGVNKES